VSRAERRPRTKQANLLPPGSIDFDAEIGGGAKDDFEDNNLVWIDPRIWQQPTPTVQCFFPCTLVLPALPAVPTTTIDYPRLKVTEDGSVLGTLTFPPITVTEYALSTLAVGAGRRRQEGTVVQVSV
jgi:hypothetical protein